MKKRLIKGMMFMCCMVLALGMTSVPGHAGDPKFIKIAGSGIAGTWFRVAAATAEILNQNVKDVVFTATLGGGLSNIRRIEDGSIQMGLAMTSGGQFAFTGVDPFEKKKSRIRALYTAFVTPYQLVAPAHSNVYKVSDLVGKSFAPSLPGWSTELYSRILLKAHGLSYEDIEKAGGKIHYVNWTEMVKLMKDRRLDAAMFATPDPVPQIMDITTAFPIRMIQVDEEMINAILREYPSLMTYKTYGGTYRGQDEDIVNVADGVMMLIRDDISDDLAYRITKAVYDNIPTLAQVHPAMKELNTKTGIAGITIPLHPGAARYYKEQGVKILPSN